MNTMGVVHTHCRRILRLSPSNLGCRTRARGARSRAFGDRARAGLWQRLRRPAGRGAGVVAAEPRLHLVRCRPAAPPLRFDRRRGVMNARPQVQHHAGRHPRRVDHYAINVPEHQRRHKNVGPTRNDRRCCVGGCRCGLAGHGTELDADASAEINKRARRDVDGRLHYSLHDLTQELPADRATLHRENGSQHPSVSYSDTSGLRGAVPYDGPLHVASLAAAHGAVRRLRANLRRMRHVM